MMNLKTAGAVALLALSPLAISAADAQPGHGGRGGGPGMSAGAGMRGGPGMSGGMRGGQMRSAPGGGMAANVGRNDFRGGNVNTGGNWQGGNRVAWQGRTGGGDWNRGGWDRGGRRGWGGAGVGFATGVAAGAAFAGAPYGYGYYGDGYGYGYDDAYYDGGWGNWDDSYAYDNGPAVGVTVSGGGGDVDYCIQRFKSYDPASGTYLGYDGERHPCP